MEEIKQEEKMELICPIMSNVDFSASCEEGQCGIWDKKNKQCSVVTIAGALEKLR